jgi:hypothetical protein
MSSFTYALLLSLELSGHPGEGGLDARRLPLNVSKISIKIIPNLLYMDISGSHGGEYEH